MQKTKQLMAGLLAATLISSTGAVLFEKKQVRADAGVAINSSNFSPVLVDFVKDYEKRFGNNDGYLSEEEGAGITEISIQRKNLEQGKTYLSSGLQYMPNLNYLAVQWCNITSIDVSHNPNLERLILNNDELTSISLKNNQKLMLLGIESNKITELDITSCPYLVDAYNSFEPHHYTDFGGDFYAWNGLNPEKNSRTWTYISADRNVKIKSTGEKFRIPIDEEHFSYVLSNYLQNEDKNKWDKDGYLSLIEAKTVVSLDFFESEPPEGKTDLDKGMEYLMNLSKLSIVGGGITSVNVRKNPTLKKLDLFACSITSIDVSQNTELEVLALTSTKISSLDISKNTKLMAVYVDGTNVQKLDISNCPILVEAYNTIPRKEVNDDDFFFSVWYGRNEAENDDEWMYITTNPETEIIAEKIVLPSVTTLKAESAGKNKVKLTWGAAEGAEGYLIYAKKGKTYAYVGMTTKGTTYTDTKALDSDYNYYWVYPYIKGESGNMLVGTCSKYAYAKGVTLAVTNLKANGTTGKVTLTWTASQGAEGYLIYGIRPGQSYGYIGMTTKGTTFTDTKASKADWTFYWVFPYHKDAEGKMIVGGTAPYVYSKAR
ncbi:MAG: hypothetical protein J6T40_08655 [Clostridiales bacterium]|nr:hypothetical protein [Clostridiales bacterium]